MKKNTCRCGLPKNKNRIVCETCWKGLPGPLRAAFNMAPDSDARRIAVRKILDHCNGTPSFL